MSTGLLPPGCYDVLPPFAGQEAAVSGAMVSCFEQFSYALTSPPLLEYTDDMLVGRGARLSPHILRVVDPKTNRVMGLRADMTLQLARIAATRLQHAPRPLRLSYAGMVLRLQQSTLEPNRQLRQLGLEHIGAGPNAEAEVVFIALHALKKAGISGVTIDLHFPAIISALLAEGEAERAEDVLAQKDIAALARLNLKHGEALIALIKSAGTLPNALAVLHSLSLPTAAHIHVKRLLEIIESVKPLLGDAALTLDITERRGFDYYTGASFSFFAKGATSELGRGGRYRIGEEDAVGCSFFAEHLRECVAARAPVDVKPVTLADLAAIEQALAAGLQLVVVE